VTFVQRKGEAMIDKDHHHTIIRIPDKLWNEIRLILPKEKPFKTIGRPIVPYRKVLNGILYILRTGCQWKMLPSEFGSGSTCHRRFQEWNKLDVFKKMWVRLLKSYDDVIGINWTWQSIDSISIKSPLGGGDDRKQSHRQKQTGNKKARFNG
jgi:transposase